MSYWIEYQAACFRLEAARLGSSEDRFVIATEAGSNNLTERSAGGRERRVREWSISMLGTRQQVLRSALRTAAACAGGNLQVRSTRVSPETYYRRIKRLLANPCSSFDAHVTLSATVAEGHVLIAQASACGYVVYPETSWGQTRVKLIPPSQVPSEWARYFELVDPFLDDGSIEPHALGQIFGLRAS